MCSGPDKSKSASSSSSAVKVTPEPKDMSNITVNSDDSFSNLLEFAANNDVQGFKQALELGPDSIDDVGLWYSRQAGSKQIVLKHRTPLMVAATYGSVEVLKLILSHAQADVNISCGPDKSTALHCAASGGSVSAIDAVKLLLSAGADPNCRDANGHCPVDVVVMPPKLHNMKTTLQELLKSSPGSPGENCLRVSVKTSNSESLMRSTSPDNESPASHYVSSPMASKFNEQAVNSVSEKKEYPVDPSIPDIKNSIYTTDEFRMFSFKVRPCSRAYSHDWTECPFVHPGENARRRDPRKFHYSCVPCPDFQKGACRRGDMCEYAHGVFECWLHPAQYRTRLCKDGTSCNRRVCFFAHTPEERRPLYVSTGSAVPSPRSSASASAASVMDMAAAMNLLPGSPTVSSMSPSPFGQSMSPSGNDISHATAAWPQPNVPTLHLPGSNLQSSRLRSSLSVRDIPPDNLNMLLDFDSQHQILNDLTCFPQSHTNFASVSRSGRSKTLAPSNLEQLFSAELSSSPRYADHAATSVFSPSHKSALLNQFQQQQSMLSPINTNVFSQKNVEHHLLQASFGVASPGRMSPRRMSPRSMEPSSPIGARLSALAQREKQYQQQLRGLSSPGVGPQVNSWTKWGSPNGKLDWSVNGDELAHLHRLSSSGVGNNVEEPDLSWVQSLVKESPPEMMKEKAAVVPASGSGNVNGGSSEGLSSKSQIETSDHSVIGAWLEQMQLDQLVV